VKAGPIRRAALLAAATALASCRGREIVNMDLVALAPVAEHARSYGFFVLGTPGAEPARGPGLLRDDGGGNPRLWSKREAEIQLQLEGAAPRAVVLDLTPLPGIANQSLRVTLDGVDVSELDIRPERRRYLVPLPAPGPKAGAAKLGLHFRDVATAGSAFGRRVAAALHAVAWGDDGDPALLDLLARGAPPPLALEKNPARIVQTAGALRYALRVPRGGELRFTPRLHPAAVGARPRFRVQLESEAGSRELWARDLDTTSAPSEVRVRLEAHAGDLARLSLEIVGERMAWGIWEAPRVVADEPPPPPSRRPYTSADFARAAALRSRLSGFDLLLVVLDAARAQQFGCYGYARATTPEIDRIASEGVVFERAYAPAVYTLASMASLWTSLYPDEHGAGVEQGAKLGAVSVTLAERVETRGIAAAGFVANGMAGPAFGLSRGFSHFEEVFRGHGSSASTFRVELWPWLEENRGRRFFAYAHFREPHFPYDAPSEFVARFGADAPLPKQARTEDRFITSVNWGGRELSADEQAHLVRLYDANLAFADSEIGALRRRMEELGLWEKTVVVVTSDHGEALYEHDGFVGHNQQVYEPSVHIPLIVRFPVGSGPAGVRVPALVDTLDVAPTILELLGLPGDAADGFTGRSLLPVMSGAPGKDVVFSRTTSERPRYMARDARFKYIFHSRFGAQELYDLVEDPGERHDLVRDKPLLVSFYRQLLARWLVDMKLGEVEPPPQAALTPEQRENLKALGYVQ
jgi:arylsulfatase A-like enzyme